MKFLFLPLAFLFSCTTIVFSQVDLGRIPLDSFRLPDIDRRALEFSGSFFGTYRNIHSPYLNSAKQTHDVRPRFDFAYSRYVNNAQWQRTLTYNLSHSFRVYKRDDIVDIGTELSYGSQNLLTLDQRKYKDNKFVLTGGGARLAWSFSRNKSIDTLVQFLTTERNFSGSLNLVAGFGTGRIEPVSDVAMALFVLQDVQAVGVELNSVNVNDVYGFASLMAQLRNRRIFDARRKRIQELRELYLHMDENGWVLQRDPIVFALLADNWLSNSLNSRTAGKRWTFFGGPTFAFDSRRTKSPSGEISNFSEIDAGGSIGLEFLKQQPVSLHTQKFRSHALRVGYNNRSGDMVFVNVGTNNWRISTDHTIGKGWFPNNRTSILANLTLRYEYLRFPKDLPFFNYEDQHIVLPSFSLDGTYFISWQTRLIIDASLEYGYSSGGQLSFITNTYGTSAKANGFEASVNARLFVSIF